MVLDVETFNGEQDAPLSLSPSLSLSGPSQVAHSPMAEGGWQGTKNQFIHLLFSFYNIIL
jgi:putative copper export protein